MAKNLKLKIKNTQIADAFKVKPSLKKTKIAKVTAKKKTTKEPLVKPKVRIVKPVVVEEPIEEVIETPVIEPVVEEKEPEIKAIIEPKEDVAPKEATPPKAKEEPKKEVKSIEKKKLPDAKPAKKPSSFKDFKDFKKDRKKTSDKGFDSRDKQGLRSIDEGGWRRKRGHKSKRREMPQEEILRPKTLKIRLPITVKSLASEMKLKASQLISKLFMQGITLTLNDFLEDETTVQLLGQEFDCEITIDTSEQERLKITEETIEEEIAKTDVEKLKPRNAILTFMGHVDHGKTSLIDAIRDSNIAEGESGAITQHIGAFKVKTTNSEITILDTPGHEAFTEMRKRGAAVTDIIVLVIAGDEGMRDQTHEAIKHIKEANVPIVVAINKSDKDNFDAEKVYRQLSEEDLLPEAWGGNIITVNCSASAKTGIKELLEMAALQSEVLELKANPSYRARGSVLESQMHKGLGAVATLLVKNGTLHKGDAIVFGNEWAKVKTMHDEHGKALNDAPPATPVKVTGLSGLAEAGSEFIVVPSEKEAKILAEDREKGQIVSSLKKAKTPAMDAFLKESERKKVLPIIIRADVQGSLEALKNSLMKIKSDKVELNIISDSIGEISESDVELASASKSIILGFHTRIEAHCEGLIKQFKVDVIMHNIIYHAIDEVKLKMKALLNKVAQENDMGTAEIKSVFKSSQLGLIAGCLVTDGIIKRSYHVRLIRDGEQIWKGKIASLKRVKEDIKEVSKGLECGILLENFRDIQEGDILQAFEITYHEQEL